MSGVAVLLLMIVSCAGMRKQWIADNCNFDVGYEKGVNDGRQGLPMNSGRHADACPSKMQKEVRNGYRKGYERGMKAAENEEKNNDLEVEMGDAKIRIPTSDQSED